GSLDRVVDEVDERSTAGGDRRGHRLAIDLGERGAHRFDSTRLAAAHEPHQRVPNLCCRRLVDEDRELPRSPVDEVLPYDTEDHETVKRSFPRRLLVVSRAEWDLNDTRSLARLEELRCCKKRLQLGTSPGERGQVEVER